MAMYKAVQFSSGSRGLDQLVSQVQAVPKNRVGAAAKIGTAPLMDTALNQVLSIVGRIQALSPDSPGAASIPRALEIAWAVYAWLQAVESGNSTQVPQAGTVPIDTIGPAI